MPGRIGDLYGGNSHVEAFLTVMTTNLAGNSCFQHGLKAKSNMRERFGFEEHANSGPLKVLLQILGIDMQLQAERLPGTLCATMVFVAHSRRLDAIVHFKP